MTDKRTTLVSLWLLVAYALFVFSSTFSIATAQMSLGLASVLFLVVVITRQFNPLGYPFKTLYLVIGLYLCWILLTTLLAIKSFNAFNVIREEWLFFAIPIGIYLCAKEKHRALLIQIFATGIGIISLYGILQYFTGINWLKDYPPDHAPLFGYLVIGSFPHPLTFGNYWATASLFILGYTIAGDQIYQVNHRAWLIAVGLLGVIATILSHSRGSILALLFGLVCIAMLTSKRLRFYLLGALVAIIVITSIALPSVTGRMTAFDREINRTNRMSRLYIWQESLKIATNHPFVGVGQGEFGKVYRESLPLDAEDRWKHAHAHNDLLNYAAVSGFPGMVIYLLLWLTVLRILWSGWKNQEADPATRQVCLASFLGSITFFATSFTEATFTDEEVRQMLMFIWAIGLGSRYNQYRDEMEQRHEIS